MEGRLASARICLVDSCIELLELGRELWRGAEAVTYLATFMGMPAVAKIRVRKPFLPEPFDEFLRRKRTRTEARIMEHARALGVKVPRVLFVDVDSGLIVMERIEGEVLRDAEPKLLDEELCRAMAALGEYAAKLHDSGIVHGDLTTGNAIVSSEGLYLIDFGLAEYVSVIDEHAIDVHIAFRSIESSHGERAELMKRCFVEGYERVRGEEVTRLVLAKVEEIRSMGRYVSERKRVRTVWEIA